MIIEWIIANKELFKMIYAMVILLICSFTVIKADRFFKISDYQGLRYFRNAFFFFSLSIVIRFILSPIETTNQVIYSNIMDFLFRFFSIVGVAFLVYSLTWKKFENKKKHHSLFNISSSIFYLIAFIVSYLSLVFEIPLIFYSVQIIILMIVFSISLKNCILSGKRYPLLITYSIAILIWIFAWVIEGMKFFLAESDIIQIVIYCFNILFFTLFSIGIRSLSNEI